MSNSLSQKPLDNAKKSTPDATKTALKRAIQKTAEKTGDLNGNEIVYKITIISKSPQNASKELNSKTNEHEIEIPKEKYISSEKIQQIIDELRIMEHNGISKNNKFTRKRINCLNLEQKIRFK